MIIVALIVLGLGIGSFVNALVWRLHMQSQKNKKGNSADYSIVRGRSMCPECKHTLGVIDLIPVFSWLTLGGKCRYCRKTISWQYPAIELLTVVAFIISYMNWPYSLNVYGSILFAIWLLCLTVFLALAVYDIRWMLLPNKLVFGLYSLIAVYVFVLMLSEGSFEPFWGALAGVLVGGGIFYILFQLSGGKWIGGGDVKLGFALGALAGSFAEALLLLFIASLMGSIISIPLFMSKRVDRKARIAFGPFLLVATFIVVLWGQEIIDWYLDFAII